MYLHTPPWRHRSDASAPCLSIYLPPAPGAPSHPRLGLTSGVHISIYLSRAWSPSHGRRPAFDFNVLPISLPCPRRRRT
eukprot:9492038-Pyramimonas_sp.AAC.1